MNTRTVPSGLSLDTVFRVLSERRKRHVLYALRGAEGNAMTVKQLARRVRELEGSGMDENALKRIAEDLRERHIPELVATDAVEYDERSETARYHSVPSLEEWLEHAEYKELGRVVS
ncbi:hypothetical protein HAPAU_00570 [Halalkalicoccus paucihalophilus]|uniref:DUF7344 domain-containing protein n=1 Tax=Halalkalicoccus paucihalophilus TaxID=1008153 RepID=A0A151AIB4_9EURY|nr:hypothetical protein [Halalkalicoccus paucihalophilus]KYH27391.1 hypothetical protein HAPAU_00570 [Halalkalicoccus paucihalophilus]